MGRAPLSDAELNARGFRRLPLPDDGKVVCIVCHPVPNPIGRRNMISHETTDKHKKALSEKAVRDAQLSYQARWKAHSANTVNGYEIPVSNGPRHSMATPSTDSQSRTYSTINAVTSDPLPLLAGDNPQEPIPYTDTQPVFDETLLPITIEEHEALVANLWQQCEDEDIERQIMEGFDPVEDSRHHDTNTAGRDSHRPGMIERANGRLGNLTWGEALKNPNALGDGEEENEDGDAEEGVTWLSPLDQSDKPNTQTSTAHVRVNPTSCHHLDITSIRPTSTAELHQHRLRALCLLSL
ncbi:hypothetical protein L198_08235 [Cryptococcus wingfieldii CBS 7118]|uniref:Uncharacterized protein n=1 Tax=Cryptococcus wingfieldii CBS 7118 TaxID=1295528 RepID=A0A1E3HD49_9TREE|nr:hypothetical protein L198_08235 [Cryptococcus wingfieldii CBS 7118]ODN74270.1 hypothetical protein L198_08235 [Cryptococcus wingfieldii CBS 7118]